MPNKIHLVVKSASVNPNAGFYRPDRFVLGRPVRVIHDEKSLCLWAPWIAAIKWCTQHLGWRIEETKKSKPKL